MAGGRLPVAAALLPVPAARRRLRHQRLLDRPARVRRPGRRRRAGRGGPQAGHPDHRRPGHEPHQRPAPLVPRVAPGPHQPQGRLVRLERRRHRLQRRPGHLRRHREVQLDLRLRSGASTTGTGSSPTSRTSTTTIPKWPTPCSTSCRYWLDIGLDGFRLDAVPVPVRAGGHQLREPPRDPRVPAPAAQGGGRALPGQGAAGRGQPVARGRRRVLRRRRRVPHVLPLPGHAPDVHGRAARAASSHHRDPGPHAGDPRRAASGGSSCATTTS